MTHATTEETVAAAPRVLWLREGAWWLHPAWTAIMALVPGILIALLATDDDFRRWWGSPKYYDFDIAMISFVLLLVFIAGVCLPQLATGYRERLSTPLRVTPRQHQLIARTGRVLLILTVVGYSLYWMIAFARGLAPAHLIAALRLDPGALVVVKRLFVPVAGVTTFTQFGPLAITCLALDRRLGGSPNTLGIAVLIVIGVMRAVFQAERLALIEVVLPLLVITAALNKRGAHRTRNWLWASAPLLAPAAVVILFGTFEYARSWNDFYAQSSDMDYATFVLQRLGGYYATANNNSAMLLTYLSPIIELPYYTVQFIWNLPGVSALMDMDKLIGLDIDQSWKSMIDHYGNPELNSEGGLLLPVSDYGVIGGAIFLSAVGLLLGLIYQTLRHGDIRGFILFPIMYVGLIELARYFYFGQGRAFPGIMAGLVLCFLLKRAHDREAQV